VLTTVKYAVVRLSALMAQQSARLINTRPIAETCLSTAALDHTCHTKQYIAICICKKLIVVKRAP
jgi:hypothetical protein